MSETSGSVTSTAPPRVSVVLAVYDGERHIETAVRSVLSQSFTDFELIVIDDGSVDGTPGILAALQRSDRRILVQRQENRGLAAALNRGAGLARGAYVARQDADDVSLPDRFARQVAYLDAHPHVAAVGAQANVIDGAGGRVGALTVATGPPAVSAGLKTLRSTPVHGAMMIRKSVFDAAGGYRCAFRYGQDYDLWLRLISRFDIDNLPDVLYEWRIDRDSVYASQRTEQLHYAGIARVFATEREQGGTDSYASLEECAGDIDRFARRYRLAPEVYALWGELLLRGVGNSPKVRNYFLRAVLAGDRRLRTLCLTCWAQLRLPWPGGRPLALAGGRRRRP